MAKDFHKQQIIDDDLRAIQKKSLLKMLDKAAETKVLCLLNKSSKFLFLKMYYIVNSQLNKLKNAKTNDERA